ncbi:MAG: toll/interleukin-1 receptor domain-containing protein [Geminicoccaceae bacterium]
MTGDPRIFISYSRQDGAAAAAEIREGLAKESLSLWQDLVAMEGGRDWWRQIEEAIGKAEYLVLLLTPKALASEVCAKEWRYARQQGTYVVPVSDGDPGKLELQRLAGWMRRADIVDFRVPERWTWLVGL